MNQRKPANPVACLYELSGEHAGASHFLNRPVFRMGADSENDLVLKESSVALYQVEIHALEHGHLLKNLSIQGNAFLNGEPFEEALLQKGDILTLGESMIRYVAMGEVLTQEELWRPVGGLPMPGKTRPVLRWKAALAAIAGGSVLGMILLSLLLRHGRQVEEEVSEEGDAGIKAIKVMERPELQTLYDGGTAYLSARRWDEALVIFEQLREGAPNFKDADQLFQQATAESRNNDMLNLAKGLFLEGEWAEAREKLGNIPKESVFFREKEQFLREIDLLVAAARMEKARAFLSQNEWLAARQEAETILELFPDHQEARSIRDQATRMLSQGKQAWKLLGRAPGDVGKVSVQAPPGAREIPASMDKGTGIRREDPAGVWEKEGRKGEPAGVWEKEVRKGEPAGVREMEARQGETAEVRGPQVRKGKTVGSVPEEQTKRAEEVSKTPDPPRGTPAWSLKMAVSAYRKGDVEQALRVLDPLLQGAGDQRLAGQAREMAGNLQGAMSCYRQAKTLEAENRVLEALEMWEQFLAKDRRVAGSLGGVFYQRASDSLGRIYSQRGDQAFSAGDLTKAYRFWSMAGRVNPQDENARRGLRQLADAAQKLYREGYSLQYLNPARAVEIWKLVMQIVPPDHPYYQEARKQVGRLAANP